MKKTTVFLFGLLLIPIMLASLLVTGVIFNTGKKIDVETYFFQPSNTPLERPGVPASPKDLGKNALLNMLISRYVTEYFYVIPDLSNVEARLKPNANSSLYLTSGKAVFEHWVQNIAPQIQEMAEQKMLRLVAIESIEKDPNANDYWIVSYSLTTWNSPNNFVEKPTTVRDTIYMNIQYEPDIRLTITTNAGEKISAETILESGQDPASVFKFRVLNISTYNQ